MEDLEVDEVTGDMSMLLLLLERRRRWHVAVVLVTREFILSLLFWEDYSWGIWEMCTYHQNDCLDGLSMLVLFQWIHSAFSLRGRLLYIHSVSLFH